MITSKLYFGSLTEAARELTAAEQHGGPIPARFDFSVQEACASCMQNIKPPKKLLRCSACRAVLYCSSEVRNDLCFTNDHFSLKSPLSAQDEPGANLLCPTNQHIKCFVLITR